MSGPASEEEGKTMGWKEGEGDGKEEMEVEGVRDEEGVFLL